MSPKKATKYDRFVIEWPLNVRLSLELCLSLRHPRSLSLWRLPSLPIYFSLSRQLELPLSLTRAGGGKQTNALSAPAAEIKSADCFLSSVPWAGRASSSGPVPQLASKPQNEGPVKPTPGYELAVKLYYSLPYIPALRTAPVVTWL